MLECRNLSNNLLGILHIQVYSLNLIPHHWQLTDERSNSKFMDNYYKGILDWSEKNDIRLKGHPLMWHEAMPNWVRNFKNIEELDEIIKEHMKRLIVSYPQINDWDVYNEPIGPFKPHIHQVQLLSGLIIKVEYILPWFIYMSLLIVLTPIKIIQIIIIMQKIQSFSK